ncbi:hypothetical protein KUTeg_017940 [Tegillarca granosa]|uniref:Uncharacterized protein n=1 Tax=Tegillarca granosa TaxID=220873 RepID=A0ABQ9EGD9_TEGGR|nr:hypothetical protein KUTeg_017940 [Tegillarca granosa]
MYAKDKETNTEENVCNYLLSSDDLRKKKRTREVKMYKRLNMLCSNIKSLLKFLSTFIRTQRKSVRGKI